jgi:hypothetical protein
MQSPVRFLLVVAATLIGLAATIAVLISIGDVMLLGLAVMAAVFLSRYMRQGIRSKFQLAIILQITFILFFPTAIFVLSEAGRGGVLAPAWFVLTASVAAGLGLVMFLMEPTRKTWWAVVLIHTTIVTTSLVIVGIPKCLQSVFACQESTQDLLAYMSVIVFAALLVPRLFK